MRIFYITIAILIFAGMTSCRDQTIEVNLTGKWQCGLVDGHGNWCATDPEVELFPDGTLEITNRYLPAPSDPERHTTTRTGFALALYEKGTWHIDNGSLVIKCEYGDSRTKKHFEISPDKSTLKLENSPHVNWQMRRL